MKFGPTSKARQIVVIVMPEPCAALCGSPVRFGKQHNGAVVIDDKLMDNRLMRSDHLREGAFEALRKKCRELEEENERLRNLLAEHGVAPAPSRAMPSVEPAPVKSSLSTPEKITLFRSLARYLLALRGGWVH